MRLKRDGETCGARRRLRRRRRSFLGIDDKDSVGGKRAAKLSVALCTYDGEAYLNEQLQSFAAQTRLPDELVVCDDRSQDGSVRVVEEFARRAPFPVRLFVNEKNLGSTKNFERAIRLCEGDLIALSDQDDVWRPDKLRRLEEALEDRGKGLSFTNGEIVDESLRSLGRSVWEALRFGESERRMFREGRAFSVLIERNVVTGAALCFRSELREIILPLPENLVHDGGRIIHDGWTGIIVSAVSDLAYVPEKLFLYRQHARQQLGAMSVFEEKEDGPGAAARLRAAARRRNLFSTELEYLRGVRERLSNPAGFDVRAEVSDELSARLKHLETRATLPDGRIRRAPRVLRELLARRYHLYSNGFASAAKDLWL